MDYRITLMILNVWKTTVLIVDTILPRMNIFLFLRKKRGSIIKALLCIAESEIIGQAHSHAAVEVLPQHLISEFL